MCSFVWDFPVDFLCGYFIVTSYLVVSFLDWTFFLIQEPETPPQNPSRQGQAEVTRAGEAK